jgi:hypothetical protein
VANVSPVSGYFPLITYAVADLGVDELEENGGDEVFEAVTDSQRPQPVALQDHPLRDDPSAARYRVIRQDPSSGLRLWRRVRLANAP